MVRKLTFTTDCTGGRSALHFAASEGHVGVVKLLLLHGAYVNARDLGEDHISSLWHAANCSTLLA